MMDLLPLEMFWRTALAAIPLAMLVAFISRALPCRPSTRHLMWVSLVVILIFAPFLPRLSRENTQALRETAGDLVAKAALFVPEMPAPLPPPPDAGNMRKAQDENIQPWGGESLLDTRPHQRSIWDVKSPEPSEWSRVFSAKRSSRKNDEWLVTSVEKPSFARPSARQSDRKPAAFYPTTSDEMREMRDDEALASLEVDRDQLHTSLFSAPLRSALNDSLTPGNSRRPSESFAPFRELSVKTGAIETEQTKGSMEPSPLPSTPADGLFNAWLIQLAMLRDAVLNLPPIPGSVWFGGMALLLLVLALRVGESLRFLRLAKPAPHWVTQEVRNAARDIGLKRIPTTLMVEARISPMVWCGRKVLLVLPVSLWEQLDAVGRGAVIRHELAHLRRRDHWVAWVDLAAGVLYWWHPVMWWIRRRIREEADLSCDAWVTALVPGSRRAYAEALLETKKYVSSFVPAGPATGLGVTKLGAKTFARRLKMVMTEQKTPGWSLAGVALAAVLLVVGCIVTPIWACPPDEKPSDAYKTQEARTVRIVAPSAQFNEAVGADASTFERFMRDKDDDTISRRKTDSPTRVFISAPAIKVGKKVDKKNGVKACGEGGCCCCSDGSRSIRFAGPDDRVIYTVSPATDCRVPTSECTIIVQDGQVVQVPGNIAYSVRALPVAEMAAYVVIASNDDDEQDEEVSRIYRLPRGKLRALINLMAREDVPVLISPHDDGIEIFSTARQQKIFKAFVNLIHPEGDGWDAREGEWEDEGETYEAWEGEHQRAREHEWRSIVADHERAMRDLERQMGQVQRHHARARERAERLRDRAESYRDKAEEARNESEECEGQAREEERESRMARLLEKAATLAMKSEEYEARSEQLEAESESMEYEAENLEEQAMAIEEQAQELHEQLEELEEEFQEVVDDGCDDDDDEDDEDWDEN